MGRDLIDPCCGATRQRLPRIRVTHKPGYGTSTVDSEVGLSSTDPARSEHCYTASATEDEVVAWYAAELASRGLDGRADVWLPY
jgi:hypothetical protein